MIEANNDLCGCEACPASGCNCGCQDAITEKECACGPACACGVGCNCANCEKDS
jgi:hypothetical protein